MNRHFQAKLAKYQHLIETTVSIPNKCCTVTNITKYFAGGPNVQITNPRWRTAAILKNRKIALSQQWFDRST